MRILTTGSGRSGSWQCRGVQLGGAVGDVSTKLVASSIRNYDVVIGVKRVTLAQVQQIRAAGVPWIWDLVDFYPQPECSAWSRDHAIAWVRRAIKALRPDGIIYATKRMAVDIGMPGVTIYHHARAGVPENPIREEIRTVGYEGSERYLGSWGREVQSICKRKGWRFVVNGPYRELDVVLALRDSPHAGYVQTHWKSNVKLANAHSTGTPFIAQKESGYKETGTGDERWVSRLRDLGPALEELEAQEVRQAIAGRFKAATITLDQCANEVIRYAKTLVS